MLARCKKSLQSEYFESVVGSTYGPKIYSIIKSKYIQKKKDRKWGNKNYKLGVLVFHSTAKMTKRPPALPR